MIDLDASKLSVGAYKPEHFKAQEFASRSAFERYGNRVLRYIDTRILITADQLRNQFGPMTINNWSWGGEREFSGLRLAGDNHFSKTSDHSWGRAIDGIFLRATAQEVRDYIEDNPEQFPFITFIEEGKGITWLHVGCPNLIGLPFVCTYDNSLVFWNKDTGAFREVFRKNGGLLNARN